MLGIDPGTRSLGYGLVRSEGENYRAVDYGNLIIDDSFDFPQRLLQIYRYVSSIIDKWKPDGLAVEEVYVSQNAKTTLRLGHARGVIILAGVEKNISIAEYAPREIKRSILGMGGASKRQVQHMVAQLLNINCEQLQEDAADGLATALCHILRSSKQSRYQIE